MKKLLTLLFVLSLSFTSVTFAQETIQKTYCMSSIGYKSDIDDLKKELLNNAKRDAVNELFGELIKSFTKVENFKLTEDKIRASSAGFVRIKGNPAYCQGKNLGELCVKIEAYAKDEDFEKFKPKILTKKSCIAEGDVKTIKGRTEEKAKLEALIDYDQTLQKYPPKHILPLLHEIKFLESDFISSTSVYCVKVRGLAYPIEIAALTEASEPVIAKKGQILATDIQKESVKVTPISKNSNCKEKNTGDYCFINTKRKTSFTIAYSQTDSKNKMREIIVQPGQTQCIYGIPAGPYNYKITYKARVPIMEFPPGAPTMIKKLTYLKGQIYVEKCKSINFEIK